MQWNSPILLSHALRERAGIAARVRESTLMFLIMLAAMPAN